MGGVSKDEKLTAFHVNGVEESNKKVCTLSHDKKEDVGNSIGVQRVKYVEKVGQENIKPDGSDNGPIWVSLNRYGPKGQIGMGFKDKAQEFKSSWANMIDETLNSAAMGRSGWVIVCLDYKALSGSGFCVFPTIHILRSMGISCLWRSFANVGWRSLSLMDTKKLNGGLLSKDWDAKNSKLGGRCSKQSEVCISGVGYLGTNCALDLRRKLQAWINFRRGFEVGVASIMVNCVLLAEW
ncbi:hypothetical protein V6N12_058230 [Hibiscus sabdariffa]|uniref:Superoxide dismutase n=1 Tax=Hibiscus sabdariffa TaxID=183260 RepID=A0ABR2EU61_9ROSI